MSEIKLDEISLTLGEIRSDLKYQRQWLDDHEEADQSRFEQLAVKIEKANGYNYRILAVEDHVKQFLPVIESTRRVKWLFAGFIAGIGIVGGAVGGFAAQLFKFFT